MEQSAALDQWRGIALLLVLVSHGFYFTDRVHGVGRVGVNLFFFISGLLVFRSLATNPEPVAFWWRRFRRLYPALAAFVLLMAPLTWLFHDFAAYGQAFGPALVFASDYLPPVPPRSLGHLWSIAVEVQFYLVAPLVFLLGRRRPYFWGGLLLALMAAGALAPILDPSGRDKYHLEYAVWPMMLGFCCEAARERLDAVPSAALISRVALAVFCGSLVLMVGGVETKELVIAGGAFALVPCLYAYLQGQEVAGVQGRSLTWLGQRTYSIYLWQQPLTICNYLPLGLQPLGAAASIAAGALSFRLFEQPFLSSRRRKHVAAEPLPEGRVVGAVGR